MTADYRAPAHDSRRPIIVIRDERMITSAWGIRGGA
jgi:hypothetical protein